LFVSLGRQKADRETSQALWKTYTFYSSIYTSYIPVGAEIVPSLSIIYLLMEEDWNACTM
jgi:hypothetical protein